MTKHSTLGKKMIASLSEAVEAMEQGRPEKLTVRTVTMPPKPRQFDAHAVKVVRSRLSVSQAVFGALLGVSTVLVQSWEQGARKPSRIACRLLEEIERNPDHWKHWVAA